MRFRTTFLSGIWLFMFCFAVNVQAVAINGAKFSDTVIIEQTELHLRGIAVLKWAMLFDVYAGALYLPETLPGRSWHEDLPKRLELSYFREFDAADFGNASDKLLRRNLSEVEYQQLAQRLEIFYALFRDVEPGDRYSLTYRPTIGTELRLNDELLGSVAGADFAVAYFGIWLGESPISENFRDSLLLAEN